MIFKAFHLDQAFEDSINTINAFTYGCMKMAVKHKLSVYRNIKKKF